MLMQRAVEGYIVKRAGLVQRLVDSVVERFEAACVAIAPLPLTFCFGPSRTDARLRSTTTLWWRRLVHQSLRPTGRPNAAPNRTNGTIVFFGFVFVCDR